MLADACQHLFVAMQLELVRVALDGAYECAAHVFAIAQTHDHFAALCLSHVGKFFFQLATPVKNRLPMGGRITICLLGRFSGYLLRRNNHLPLVKHAPNIQLLQSEKCGSIYGAPRPGRLQPGSVQSRTRYLDRGCGRSDSHLSLEQCQVSETEVAVTLGEMVFRVTFRAV